MTDAFQFAKTMFRKLFLSLLFVSLFFATAIRSQEHSFECTQEQYLDGSLPRDSKLWRFDEIQNSLESSAIRLPIQMGAAKIIGFVVQKQNSTQDSKFVVQLGLPSTSSLGNSNLGDFPANTSQAIANTVENNDLFNCYIDRSDQNGCSSGADNPRCCYSNEFSSVHKNLAEVYPNCSRNSCNLREWSNNSCRAICSYKAIVQLEFQSLQTGEIHLSILVKRLAMIQHQGYFSEIDDTVGDSLFKTIKPISKSSSFSDEELHGFWLKWIDAIHDNVKEGPVLEMGYDGSEVPFLVHRFREVCLDCDTQDQHGWHGKDVQLPKVQNVFRPQLMSLNGVEGSRYHIFTNCSNIIYSRSQSQRYQGGSCFTTEQCQRWCPNESCSAYRCLPASDLKSGLEHRKTCQ